MLSHPDGLKIALARIAEEREKRTGFLDLGRLELKAWPEELWGLEHLMGLNLGRFWTDSNGERHSANSVLGNNEMPEENAEWGRLPNLRILSVAGSWDVRSEWKELSKIASLDSLEVFDCAGTKVRDLEALTAVTSLRFLDCSSTQIGCLKPLSKISKLVMLNCSLTQVRDLEPLKGLSALQSLHCFHTQISCLKPILEHTAMLSLNCAQTKVISLDALANLVSLQSLHCYRTGVSDLKPIAGLGALQSLNCSKTQVSCLSPLAGLKSLRTLNCSSSLVNSLEPLATLDSLQALHCSRTAITNVPKALIWKNSLKYLHLQFSPSALHDIPAEVLSQGQKDNCLYRVRAHFNDLDLGKALLPDVKVLVLGNGRVGKTQICNRLRGLDFESDPDSTHGISVTTKPLQPGTLLRLWDFGGQDLYHGTHALFMRARAIFVLVWTPESEPVSEADATHEHEGTIFRNHPLAWWVAYVKHTAGVDTPVLVIQNQCDRQEDERRHSPLDDVSMGEFGFCKELHYSARNDRNRPGLDNALSEAIAWLRKGQGQAVIGRGRLAVKDRLDSLRNADANMSDSGQRRYRTLTCEHFREICDESGEVTDPILLLDYFHHSGVVFYQRGLFEDHIILDQGWALDAIYSVFNRRKCWKQLKQLEGLFTRTLLAALVWQEYSVAEQELFLSMMQSCRICFIHRMGDDKRGIDTEYLAPDLLPDYQEVVLEVEGMWDEAAPCEEIVLQLPFMHSGVMRGLVSRIGQRAGMTAVYWKGGVCAYENTTRSHAHIRQQISSGGASAGGSIQIRTQKGRLLELSQMLRRWAEEAALHAGLRIYLPPKNEVLASSSEGEKSTEVTDTDLAVLGPEFALLPRKRVTYGVSYAWNDDSKKIVDQLCEQAMAKHDVTILRDTNGLGLGEVITRFMGSLAAQDQVFVILSAKYLQSPSCMYELWQIWVNCRTDDEEFRRRIRVFRLPDAAMMTPIERARCAKHWRDQFKELDELVRSDGADLLGEADFKRYKRMQDFANRVGDILGVISDTLLPRDFAELERHGFNQLSESQ